MESKEQQFEKLFDETSRMIYNLGLRLFRNNQEEALDFSQDVYLKAYQKLHTYKGNSKMSTWLYSLAMNHGLNRIRSLKKMKITAETEIIEQIPSSSDPEDEIVGILERQEIEAEIQSAINDLPENYRLPIILLYFERMQYSEMSEKLNIPEGTLKSLVYRGKMQLREKLKDTVELR